MINGARNVVNLARYNAMFRWGAQEGFKYGLLLGVLAGALIPIIVFLLITR